MKQIEFKTLKQWQDSNYPYLFKIEKQDNAERYLVSIERITPNSEPKVESLVSVEEFWLAESIFHVAIGRFINTKLRPNLITIEEEVIWHKAVREGVNNDK